MAEISLLAGARADFDAAFDWYATRSASAAIHFENAVADALERVARDPARFASIDTIHRQARVKRFPYRVVFRVDGAVVAVIALAHHSQRPGYWRKRSDS